MRIRPSICLVLLAVAVLRAGAGEPRGPGPSAEPVVVTYKEVAGGAIRATVHRTPGEEVRPALLWIHGGGLILGSRNDLLPEHRARYVAAGFVVVAIDYRLAPEAKMPEILEDVQDAWRWVRREGPVRFGIDPDRIAVVGHSAGGYLALLAGARLEPRPRALVSFYGYGDIAGAWANEPSAFYSRQPAIARDDALRAVGPLAVAEDPPRGRGRLYRYFRQQGAWAREVCGFDPAREPARSEAWCPQRLVTREFPATLLLHGDADTDVPVERSAEMHAALRALDVPCVFIRDPAWPHGFDGQPGFADPGVSAAFDQVIDFLTARLRPAPTFVPDAGE